MTVRVHVSNFQSIKDATIEVDGFTVVTGSNNTGKALAHGTKVATPEGWVPVEALVVGQQVLAGDGQPTTVLGVYPQGVRPMCRVTFDDGRQVVCDQDHLWQVSLGANRFPEKGQDQKWQVLTTLQILGRVGVVPSAYNRPAIPVCGPAGFVTRQQPLDPYLMGVLLGDGSFRGTPRVTSADDEVLQSVGRLVPAGVRLVKSGKYDYRLVLGKGRLNPVTEALRKMGLAGHLSPEKWVPEVYLLGSPAQRLALLQGLLDTDGGVNRQGAAEFYSSSRRLAEAVQILVWSFGGAARIRRKAKNGYTYRGSPRKGLASYTVTIRLPDVPLFRLIRKMALLRPMVRRVQPLMITLEVAAPAECTCIQVAHPSGLFLVEGYLVTHNTALQRAIRGLFQNTPGTAFIREGETTCEVEVDFGDRKVAWSKGTGKRDRPTYVVDGGEPIYPGQGVPEEVAALGMTPIQAGGQEVWPNFAPQFTGQIFLLDKPGSAVAEAVADVERVGQLNRALRAAESDRRTAAATLKVRVTDLAKYEAEVATFEGLDDAVAGVHDLEQTQVQVIRIGKAVTGLHSLRDKLQTARSAVAKYAPVLNIKTPDAEEAQKLRVDLRDTQKLRDRLLKAKMEVNRYIGVGDLLVAVDADPAKRLQTALKVVKDLSGRLTTARSRVVEVQTELVAADGALVGSAKEFDAALKELGECPTCGSTTEDRK